MSEQNHSKCPGAFLMKATPSISFYCVKHNVVFGGAWVSGIRPMPKTDALDTELRKKLQDIVAVYTHKTDYTLKTQDLPAFLKAEEQVLDELQAYIQTHYNPKSESITKEAVREAIGGEEWHQDTSFGGTLPKVQTPPMNYRNEFRRELKQALGLEGGKL